MIVNRFLIGSRFVVASLFCLLAVGTSADDEKDKEKERTEVRQMAQQTLARLYKAQPSAQAALQKGYGYAVFSNTGIKILFGGSGHGEGVAVNNKTKAETFMKMFELQAGLGMGVKKFKVIFIFDNQKAFDSFVNSGWELRRADLGCCQNESGEGRSDAGCGLGFRRHLDVSNDRQGIGAGNHS